MTKPSKIFLAVFFADLEALKNLVQSEDDFKIRFKPEYGEFDYTFTDTAEIQLPELVQLHLDAWYDQRNRTDNYHESAFCGKEVYVRIIAVDAWLQRTFPAYRRSVVEYEKYYSLNCMRDRDENYMDREDMIRYEKAGFRRIDLDLVNAANKGRRQEVIELLKQGANPFIKTDDDCIVSDYAEAVECGDHFNWIVSWHDKYLQQGTDKFTDKDVSLMVTRLSTCGHENEFMRLALQYADRSLEVPEAFRRYQ